MERNGSLRILIGLAVLGVVAYNVVGSEISKNNSTPQAEMSFINFHDNWKSRWDSAPNDIQREPMRANRDEGLCFFDKKVSKWRGTVSRISPSSFSSGVDFSASVGGITTLNQFGISRETMLFQSISSLATGDQVFFSGQFNKGNKTCFYETSLTQFGSMTSPDFSFTFTEVSSVK